ncbi:MAG: Na+/H+ antiporter subunit E [Geminicoccaceae bacterium]
MATLPFALMTDGTWRARLQGSALAAGSSSALWLALVDGDLSSWPIGLVAVGASAIAGWRLGLSAIRPLAGLRLARFMASELLKSSLTVTAAALRWRLRHRPIEIAYTTALRSDGAKALFLTLATMLPGTLGLAAEGRTLRLHVLDHNGFALSDLVRLEKRVAEALGERLSFRPPGQGGQG